MAGKNDDEIRWTREAELIPLRGELNRLAREMNHVLRKMSGELLALEWPEDEVDKRIREEFLEAARLAIRYQSD